MLLRPDRGWGGGKPDTPTTPVDLATRHLTFARRHVLQVLQRCGDLRADELAACWIELIDRGEDRFGGRLPGIVSQLTWKLEALGWVRIVDQRITMTPEGTLALSS